MKKAIIAALISAATVVGVGGASVQAAGSLAGAGSGGQPAGVACQQQGISTLKALGLAWDIKLAKIRQPLPTETEPDTLAEEAVA